MAKQKKVTISVGGIEEMAKEFVDIWHQVEAGKTPKNAPIEKVTFENERLLFKTLTPRRCDLLKHVHEHGKITIRALAKELNRDYSNVHQDVKVLNHIGLILKDEKDNQYYVPWDKIVTEIPMTYSVHETKKHSHQYRSATIHTAHR